MRYESTSLQLELERNASTQTHKLLMNYLSNSTGIYIRLRQHLQLKRYPLPCIPKEVWTEVKFLYVNTGNAESHAFSAVASALVALGLCRQTNGACSAATLLYVSAYKCQFAVSSPTFLHLWVHNHTTADEPENSFFFYPFSSTSAPPCPVHSYPGFAHLHLHNSALNPVWPFPCRIISKSTSAEYVIPFSRSWQAVSRASPSPPRARARQAVTKGGWSTAAILPAALRQRFPYSSSRVSRARCKGKAVVYTTTSLTWFLSVLGSYQDFLYELFALLSSASALYGIGKTPPKAATRMVTCLLKY